MRNPPNPAGTPDSELRYLQVLDSGYLGTWLGSMEQITSSHPWPCPDARPTPSRKKLWNSVPGHGVSTIILVTPHIWHQRTWYFLTYAKVEKRCRIVNLVS